MQKPSALDRFLAAQHDHYARALAELRRGRKQSHWMWFVLPQMRGLGRSDTAWEYGIASREEAEAYLQHPLLGARLRECVAAISAHATRSAAEILGPEDAVKFRSCLTLFETVAPAPADFGAPLKQFYNDERCAQTLKLLDQRDQVTRTST